MESRYLKKEQREWNDLLNEGALRIQYSGNYERFLALIQDEALLCVPLDGHPSFMVDGERMTRLWNWPAFEPSAEVVEFLTERGLPAQYHRDMVELMDEAAHEPYAPSTLEGLRAAGYDYWALGHVHFCQELAADPPIRLIEHPKPIQLLLPLVQRLLAER